MKELKDIGCDLRYIPISQNSPDENLIKDLEPVLSRQDFHHNSPCLKIWHQHGLFPSYGKGPFFGFPIFELDEFNETEKFSLNYPDHLIVCSQWAKEIVNKNNTHVVPLGYNDAVFKPTSMPSMDLTVFGNFGKFELRKGHDILADAFHKAFQNDKDVLLVMMPHNFFLDQKETNEWTSKYLPLLDGKIQFVPRLKTQDMVYNIIGQIHCGVFPSRAEGWNLEALETLACGKHLIITNCTGHTEFCNSDNSLLIEMNSGKEIAFDNKFFKSGVGRWNSFGDDEFDQLVEHLRFIHKKRKEGSLAVNTAGIETSLEFTWAKSSQKLFNVIKENS